MKKLKRITITLGLASLLSLSAMSAYAFSISDLLKPLEDIKNSIGSGMSGLVGDIKGAASDMQGVVDTVHSDITGFAGNISTDLSTAAASQEAKATAKINSTASANTQTAAANQAPSLLHNALAVYNAASQVCSKDKNGKNVCISSLTGNTVSKPTTYTAGQQQAAGHYQTIAGGTAYTSPAISPETTSPTTANVNYSAYQKTMAAHSSPLTNDIADAVQARISVGGQPSALEQHLAVTAGPASGPLNSAYLATTNIFGQIQQFGTYIFNSAEAFVKSIVTPIVSTAEKIGGLLGIAAIGMENAIGGALREAAKHSGDQQYKIIKKSSSS